MTPTPRAIRLVASARPLLTQVQAGLREEDFEPEATRNHIHVRDVGYR